MHKDSPARVPVEVGNESQLKLEMKFKETVAMADSFDKEMKHKQQHEQQDEGVS